MCILFIKEKEGPIPTSKMIENAWRINRDGAGYAFAKDGRIVIRKGFFSPDALIEDMSRYLPDDAPALIHLRAATHGDVSPENCHPFPLSRDIGTFITTRGEVHVPVLAHNGIFGISPKGRVRQLGLSDTAQVAWTLAPFRRKLLSKDYQDVLELALQGNKVGILMPDGTLIVYGDFVPVEGADGLWASNTTYKGYRSYRYYGWYGHGGDIVLESPKVGFRPEKGAKYDYCENCGFLDDLKLDRRTGLYLCEHCRSIQGAQGDHLCSVCGGPLASREEVERGICDACMDRIWKRIPRVEV